MQQPLCKAIRKFESKSIQIKELNEDIKMINRKWFAQLTINLIQLRNAISNNARNPSLNRWIICPSKWPVAELPLGASLAQFEQVRHCLFWHPVWGPFIIFLRERGILWKSAELFIVRLLRGQSDISINNLRSLNVRGLWPRPPKWICGSCSSRLAIQCSCS